MLAEITEDPELRRIPVVILTVPRPKKTFCDKQKVVRALGKALVGEQSYNIDHRIVWPDGSVRFIHGEAAVTFDKAGRPIRMLGTVQDITVMQ